MPVPYNVYFSILPPQNFSLFFLLDLQRSNDTSQLVNPLFEIVIFAISNYSVCSINVFTSIPSSLIIEIDFIFCSFGIDKEISFVAGLGRFGNRCVRKWG
jgi:hypothetical protein